MIMRTALLAATVAVGVVACDRPEDQETGSVTRDEIQEAREDLSPAVLEALDAANDAYRAGNYEQALERYEQANAEGDVAAAWFGIYMAHLALGNPTAADSAMERAKSLAPEASLIHPTPDDR